MKAYTIKNFSAKPNSSFRTSRIPKRIEMRKSSLRSKWEMAFYLSLSLAYNSCISIYCHRHLWIYGLQTLFCVPHCRKRELSDLNTRMAKREQTNKKKKIVKYFTLSQLWKKGHKKWCFFFFLSFPLKRRKKWEHHDVWYIFV